MTLMMKQTKYLALLNSPEIREIRSLTLRKLLILWSTAPKLGPDGIRQYLGCSRRTAYDYYKALKVIRSNMPREIGDFQTR
jgi:hypothetical protein